MNGLQGFLAHENINFDVSFGSLSLVHTDGPPGPPAKKNLLSYTPRAT